MKLAKYLKKELVFLNLPYISKEEVIGYLTKALCNHYKLSCKEEIMQDIMKRENIKSTGLGKGLAIPHGRTDLLSELYVAFARSEKGIDWSSIDNKPVHFIFFIVGPSRLEKEYLETLGGISRIMIRHDVIREISTVKEPEEVIQIIKKSGVRHMKRSKE